MAVVVGGILGAAVAHRLLVTGTADRVTIFEKEAALAQHQTGRTSGVVHAGWWLRSIAWARTPAGRRRLAIAEHLVGLIRGERTTVDAP